MDSQDQSLPPFKDIVTILESDRENEKVYEAKFRQLLGDKKYEEYLKRAQDAYDFGTKIPIRPIPNDPIALDRRLTASFEDFNIIPSSPNKVIDIPEIAARLIYSESKVLMAERLGTTPEKLDQAEKDAREYMAQWHEQLLKIVHGESFVPFDGDRLMDTSNPKRVIFVTSEDIDKTSGGKEFKCSGVAYANSGSIFVTSESDPGLIHHELSHQIRMARQRHSDTKRPQISQRILNCLEEATATLTETEVVNDPNHINPYPCDPEELLELCRNTTLKHAKTEYLVARNLLVRKVFPLVQRMFSDDHKRIIAMIRLGDYSFLDTPELVKEFSKSLQSNDVFGWKQEVRNNTKFLDKDGNEVEVKTISDITMDMQFVDGSGTIRDLNGQIRLSDLNNPKNTNPTFITPGIVISVNCIDVYSTS